MTARNQDFVVKNGLQVTSNLVVGAYTGISVNQIANGAIISGNVGIGTSNLITGTGLGVYNGNIQVSGSGSGYVFPDGSLQTTSAKNTPPGGSNATVQFNLNNTFAGNSQFVFDNVNVRLGIGTAAARATVDVVGNLLISNTVSTTSGITFADGSFQDTAAYFTPSYGTQYTLQYAGTSNSFSGDSTNLVWLPLTNTLQTSNIYVNSGVPATYQGSGALNVSGGASISGNLFLGGNFTVSGNLNIANVGGIQDLTVNSLTANTIVQAATFVSGGQVKSNTTITAGTSVQANQLIANVNVGIGTATVQYPLDIYGNIHIGNAATVSGILFPDGSFQSTAAVTTAATPSYGIAGTIQFAGVGNTFSGNTAALFWDELNYSLYATAITTAALDVSGTAQINTLMVNTATSTASLNVGAGGAIVNNLYSNTFIQAAALITANSIIANVNVGIGTATVGYPLDVYGNIHIGNTATVSGVMFPDGSFQTTAVTPTPSFGPLGTIQFAGNSNTFSGNSTAFFWDSTNARLGIGTNLPTQTLTLLGNLLAYGNTHVLFGRLGIGTSNIKVGDNLTVLGGNINIASFGTGLYFPDGSFQQSSAGSSAAGTDKSVQFNDGGLFAGQSNFIFDKTATRLGIGTAALTNTLAVYGSTPAFFNTTNGTDQQIQIGNTATDGVTIGFASGTTPAYGYLKYSSAAVAITFGANGYVGIYGTTIPRNPLDVGGSMAVGTYSGSYTAPSNSLIVSGKIGVGTFAPINALDVWGTGSFTGDLSVQGTASVNMLISNAGISASNLYITGTAFVGNLYSNGFMQTAGVTTTNSLIANANITGANINITGTAFVGNLYSNGFTTTAGLTTTDSLIANANITGANINITGTAFVGNLYSNGTIQSAGLATVNQLIANANIYGSNLNIAGLAQVNSLNVNTATSTASLTVGSGGAVVNSLISNTNITTATLNSTGAALVSSLISNTNITTATLNSTGAALVSSLISNTTMQSAGTATVNALISNTNIFGATLNTSGLATVNSVSSNTTITAGTGLTVSAGGFNVTGASTLTGNLTVNGNLLINGNSIIIDTTSLRIQDPTIELGTGYGGNALTADDGFDRGTYFDYYKNPAFGGESTGFNHAFLGWQNSTNRLVYLTNVAPGISNVQANNPEYYTGYIYGGAVFGNIWLSNAQAISTSTTTGGVVTVGGLGVGGNINAGGSQNNFSGNLLLQGTNASVSSATGALIVTNGVGIGGNLNLGGNLVVSNGTQLSFVVASNSVVASSLVSNSTIQAAGTVTVNALIANANITGANLNITGTAFVGNLISNGSISGSSLSISGAVVVSSLTSNTTIQSAGTATVNALISNTTIQSTGNATVGNLISNGTITTSGAGGNILGVNTIFAVSLQGSGLTTVNALIANANITGANLNIAGTAYVGNIYSNGFTQTAGLTTTNQLIANANIYGANLNIAGLANVNSLYSNTTIQSGGIATLNALDVINNASIRGRLSVANEADIGGLVVNTSIAGSSLLISGLAQINSLISNTTIQVDGQATVNSLISNANITGANLNIVGTAWTGNTYSNGFTQTAGVTTTNSLIANANITGANLNIVGTAWSGNIYSNGFTQTAGLTTTNSLIANANITGANLNITGTAYAGNVYSNGFTQTAGLTTTNSLIANANITGANLNIVGTAWSGNTYSNGFTQTAGLTTTNSLIANANITGANLNIVGTAWSGNTYSNGFTQTAGLTTTNALVSNVYGVFGQNVTINSTNASTSTATGALVVAGGIGTAGNLYVGGNITTTGTSGNISGVNTLFAAKIGVGTTTSVGMSNAFTVYGTENIYGNLVIANTAAGGSGIYYPDGSFQKTALTASYGNAGTLQFAGVGNTFSGDSTRLTWATTSGLLTVGNVYISSNVQSIGSSSGSLTVLGGIGVVGNVNVSGNINLTGNINQITGNSAAFFGDAYGFGALYAGIPTGYVYQPNTILQLSANTNNYAQMNLQNINSGASASGDMVITADNGNNNDTYIDMGINSSQFSAGSIDAANDGYLYVAGNAVTGGGNLVLGTLANNDIVFAQGGDNPSNEVARFVYGQGLKLETATRSISTTTGALVLTGGAGITGNINVGGSRSLFTNRVGIGTSSNLGVNSNVFTVYGTENIYGNIQISNTTAGGSGIYFPDGTFQTTAPSSNALIGGTNKSVQFNDNNVFGGTTTFIYDKTTSRLGIGTAALTNTLMVYGSTPAFFNTTNGTDQQIQIGNTTTDGATIGFASGTAPAYGYAKYTGGGTAITFNRTGYVGIYATTNPQNPLDVGGAAAIGFDYAGSRTAPTNGLIVEGKVGVGTYSPGNTLDIWGAGSFTGATNTGGTATVNALVSNNNVFGASLNISGAATVNSVSSNTTITAGTGLTVSAGGFNVTGASTLTGNLTVNGNLLINGNSIIIDTTSLRIQDPTIELGTGYGGNALTADDGFDRGTYFDYYKNPAFNGDSTGFNHAFLGWQNSTNRLIYLTNVAPGISNVQANNPEYYTGYVYGGAVFGNIWLSNAQAISTSTTTGGVVTVGGLGVGGNINAGGSQNNFSGNILINGTNAASTTSAAAGALIVAGGAGIAQGLTTTGFVNFIGSGAQEYTVRFKGSSTGDQFGIATSGSAGFGIANDVLNAAGSAYSNYTVSASTVTLKTGSSAPTAALTLTNYGNGIFAQNLTVSSSNASTSTNTGALVVTGGAGIGGNLNIGGNLVVSNGTQLSFVVASNSVVASSLVSNSTIQAAGTVTVNALIANLNVFGATLQSSGQATLNSMVSNNNTFSSTLNTSGLAQLNSLIANANITTSNLNIQGNVWAGNVYSNGFIQAAGTVTAGNLYSNGFTQTAGLTTTNQLIANANIYGANLNIAGTAYAGTLYSNGFIQAAGTVTVNALISNNNVFGATLNTSGLAQLNSLISNNNITTTTLNSTGAALVSSLTSNTTIQSAGTATVNALISNNNVFGATVQSSGQATLNSIVSNNNTTTSTLNSTGLATVNQLISNANIYGANLNIAGVATVNSLVVNANIQTANLNISGTAYAGNIYSNGFIQAAGTVTVNALISNNNVFGATVQSSGQATLNSIVANNNITTTTLNSTGAALVSSLTSNTTIQSAGTATVNALISNNNVFGATLNTSGLAQLNSLIANTNTTTATLNTTGQALVNSLIANANIQGSNLNITSTAFAGNLYSNGFIQAAGTVTVNALVSNVYGVFGQNVTINSTNASTSSSTGALIVAGGQGLGGNLRVAAATTSLFGGNLGIGTTSSLGATANVMSVYGTANHYGNIQISNTVAGGSGIYFPDGTFQTTASSSSGLIGGTNKSVQFNDNNVFGGTTTFIYDKTTSRLGIGTAALTNTLAVYGSTPAFFNTTNGSDQQIQIGNTATDGVTIGFASGTAPAYGYSKYTGGGTAITFNRTGYVGIYATTNPQNPLDVGGAAAIGVDYAGSRTAPTNGLIVEGKVGVGTYSPGNTLDIWGAGSFTGATNTGGTATVNALISNVYGVFGQNVTINSTNASTSSTTGALVVAGGAGIGGNLYVGGNITTTGTNGNISGVNTLFATKIGVGTTTSVGIANAVAAYGTENLYGNLVISNTAAGGSGIYFPDGTFMTTAATGSGSGTPGGSNTNIQFNNSGTLGGSNGFVYFGNTTSVGIGTSAPAYTLDVYGNIHIGNTANLSSGLVFPDGTKQTTAANAAVQTFTFTATAGQTTFSVFPYNPGPQGVNLTQVFVNGVYQRTVTYAWTGTNIVLTSGAPQYARVEIRITVPATTLVQAGSQIAGSNVFNVQTAGVTVWNTGFTYTVGYLDVYLNGIKLTLGQDYTAGTGTSVTFAASPPVNSIVQMTGWNTNGVQQIQGNNVFNVQTNGVTVWNTGFTYTVGYLDVYVNGVKLASGYDYTATTGTSVQFTTAPTKNSLVTFEGWTQGSTLGQMATQRKAFYVASAGQTVFASQGPYVPPYVDVYVNGIKLVYTTDYTANDGATVVLTSGLLAGSNVEVISSMTFAIGDVIRRTGDIFTGNVGIGTSANSNAFVVVGTSQFYGPSSFYGNINTTGSLVTGGGLNLGGNLAVTGTASISSNLSIGGVLTFPDGSTQNTSSQNQLQVLNDISTAFDGQTTVFNLYIGSSNINIATPQQLLVSVGGAVLAPFITNPDYIDLSEVTLFTRGYKLNNGHTIVFANAPRWQQDFSGRVLSNTAPVNNTVTYPFKPLNIALADG